MRHWSLFPLALALTSLVSAQPFAQSSPADRLIQSAIDAMGRSALEATQSLEIEYAGHAYAMEQSERPEGPFIIIYNQGRQLRDHAQSRLRTESSQRMIQTGSWTPTATTIVDADTAVRVTAKGQVAGSPAQVAQAQRVLELSPERMLQTALKATDLAVAANVALHGMQHPAVSFTWRGSRVKLILNPHDALPAALEVTGPDPLFGMWGVVTETTYFSYWNLEPNGLRYPRQTDVYWNGITKSASLAASVKINPTLPADAFEITADARKAFASAPPAGGFRTAKLDPARAVDLAPNIVQLPGAWNVGVIRQPDGIVILEAPIASEYSAQVMDEVAKRYPGVTIKAVITTSDAWPHLGGVREYVARKIPIYALDLNRPILERLIAAPYGDAPDALAKAPVAPKFTWVTKTTSIGSGDTRIDLVPIRGENGERMMMAYFPAQKLLYASDEIQRLQNGSFFMPQYLLETKDAVQREKLAVTNVFGMHLPITPWQEIEKALAANGR